MSSVSDYRECEQCGYDEAYFDLDCRTNETSVSCPMCGFYAACERSVDSEGKITWAYSEQQGFGALFYTHARGKCSEAISSEEELLRAKKWLLKEIAAGGVGSGSYLTRWNRMRKVVEFVVGDEFPGVDYLDDQEDAE